MKIFSSDGTPVLDGGNTFDLQGDADTNTKIDPLAAV